MKVIFLPLVALTAILTLTSNSAEEKATSQEAEAVAQKWLDGLGDKGLVLEKATSQEAEAAAQKWLDGLGDKGLVLEKTSKDTTLKGKYIDQVKSTSFEFSADGWWIHMGFTGNVGKDVTAEELNKRLKYVALNKLPTPGLEVPGWEIKPRTPVSSFKKGVEVVALKDGTMTLRVKTEFFALYGTDPQAMRLVPADAGAPKSAYFMIRKPFNLDLTLTAPFSPPGE